MSNPFKGIARTVIEELARLHRVEREAEERKDAITVVTCRLRWAELYLAHGGIDSPSLPRLNAIVDDARAPIATARDRWLRRLQDRPLVSITNRKRVEWKDSSGAVHFYYQEKLACGHTHTAMPFFDEQSIPKRRRCKECGDARLAAGRKGSMVSIAVGMPTETVKRLEVQS